MNKSDISVPDIIEGVKKYFDYQREMYGTDVYTTTVITESVGQRKMSAVEQLNALSMEIDNCSLCNLSRSRKNLVFGVGNPNADIMLIGEAPGRDEDLQGKPFVGAAGQLLTKILAAIKLERNEVYIANILKCRPPQNRDPLPEEKAICQKHLYRQIEIIKPKFILALGRIAGQTLLKTDQTMHELRGKVYPFMNSKLIVTYHPAALLRNQQYKRPTWEDVQLLQKLYLKDKKQN